MTLFPTEPSRALDPTRGVLLPPVGVLTAEAPAEMTTGRYLALLLIVGLPLMITIQGLSILGAEGVALVVGGLVLTVLVLWRVELGLFIMAGLVFWQYQTRLSSSFTLVKGVGIVVAVLGLLHAMRSRGQPWPTVMKFALAFAIWASVSSLFNLMTPISFVLMKLAQLLSNIMFAYLLMRFCNAPAALKTLLIVVVLSATGEAVLGLVNPAREQAIGLGTVVERATTSEEININHYALLMVPGIFLAPILITQFKNHFLRLAFVGCMLLCGLAAIMTVSRGTILAIAIGAVALFITLKNVRVTTKLTALFVGAALIGGSLLLAAHLGAAKRWEQRMSQASLTGGVQQRLERYAIALEAVKGNPVLGIGVGLEIMEYARRGYLPTESHNNVVSALMTTGIPGCIMYIGLVIAAGVGIWRLPGGMIRSAILGFWVTVVLVGMFNPSLTNKLFWMPTGIVAATIICFRRPVAPAADPAIFEPLSGPPPLRA